MQPEHPVIAALIVRRPRRLLRRRDRGARERAGLPPFGRLAALIVSAADAPGAEAYARAVAARRRAGRGCGCWGRPRRRSRCCAAATACASWCGPTARSMSPDYLREWLAKVPPPRGSVTLGSMSIRRASCDFRRLDCIRNQPAPRIRPMAWDRVEYLGTPSCCRPGAGMLITRRLDGLGRFFLTLGRVPLESKGFRRAATALAALL